MVLKYRFVRRERRAEKNIKISKYAILIMGECFNVFVQDTLNLRRGLPKSPEVDMLIVGN